ncbi:MAG: DNA polymerase III subunit delta [Bacteroidales bacterium]|nr:DNA polymerase III subunit delta [Bacteroidales bacterium]
MQFKNIIGHQTIKKQLIEEVNQGRIPHAQLFHGSMGAGTFPLALAYAQYINCTQKQKDDSCGECPSCKKINKLIHPDLHFIFPIVKNSKQGKKICDDYLPEWREQITTQSYFNFQHWLNVINAQNSQAIIYAQESDEIARKLSFKSSEGDYKTVILWLPEKMHVVFANKMLKLLEEPADKTVLLLISENPENILPTILSRTQHRIIPAIEDSIIASTLREQYHILPQQSEEIAHLANGNYIKALESIHLNDEKQHFFELFVSLMRLSYQRKIKEMKAWSEEVVEMGREKQKSFLEYCQHMVRESFIHNLNHAELNYLTEQEKGFARNFAPFINESNVFDMMHELTEAAKHIEQNVNPRMVFFDFSLKTIVLIKP